MAEEFQAVICSDNWWINPSKSMFMGGSSPCSMANAIDMGTYGSWMMTDMAEQKARSSCKEYINNSALTDSSNMVFQNSVKNDSDSGGSDVFMDSTLQMMGFGISTSSSSSSSDWNQALLQGSTGGAESYNSMVQEDMNNSGTKDWSPKSFTSVGHEDSNINAFNQDFSFDKQSLNQVNTSAGNPTATCQGLSTSAYSMSMGPTSYGYPSTLLQSLFEPRQSLFQATESYGANLNELSPSWPNKISSFMKPLLPKQQTSALQFSNNTPFWNASAPAPNDIRANLLSSSQPQFLVPTFDEKPSCVNLSTKPNNEAVQDSGSTAKKGSKTEPAFKRPRIETPSPLPTFKVRKEKLGDRVTALQQLVSPFGKTDTASVLHEAIEYIKFLHDQVKFLSTPYMKNGSPIQHQQVADKLMKDQEGSSKQDLRSRGLCLVPISSTFPVANETTADFWTPTFGGTFR